MNGKVSSIAEIKQLRGFVPQDDIVHEQLTVRGLTEVEWTAASPTWELKAMPCGREGGRETKRSVDPEACWL